jgi:hypothetical protein
MTNGSAQLDLFESLLDQFIQFLVRGAALGYLAMNGPQDLLVRPPPPSPAAACSSPAKRMSVA